MPLPALTPAQRKSFRHTFSKFVSREGISIGTDKFTIETALLNMDLRLIAGFDSLFVSWPSGMARVTDAQKVRLLVALIDLHAKGF